MRAALVAVTSGIGACLYLGLCAPPQAQAAEDGAPADSTRRRAAPFTVMLRSAVLPGWGQLYNGKPLKAVAVVAGEGLLIYKALDEFHKEQDAANAFDEEGRSRHMNLKINYIWWAVAVHLLQMADAYVDAHLSDFQAGIGPDEAAFDRPGGPRLAVALRVRF